MLLPLRVSQVRGLVVVQGETQLALVGPKVVPHEVGVLLEVDGLRSKSSQSLPTIPVGLGVGGHATRPGLRTHAVLEVHLVKVLETPKER